MQFDQIKRREFITLLGGAASWPLLARGQQQAGVPVGGFLRNTPSASFEHIVAALRRGLSEAGFVDARNVAPGEKHWHGASPTTAMTHIAIQESLDGKVVEWMEHVTDEQYGAQTGTPSP
jgi:hypothetical protein